LEIFLTGIWMEFYEVWALKIPLWPAQFCYAVLPNCNWSSNSCWARFEVFGCSGVSWRTRLWTVPLVVACVGLRHLLLPRLECCVWVSVLQGNNRAGNSGLVWSGSFVSLPLPLTTSRMLPKNRRPNCTKCKLTKPSDNEPHGAKKQQQQEEHPNVSVSVSAYLYNCVSAHS